MRKRVLIFVWLFVFPLLGGVGVGYAQIITTVAGGGNCGSNYCGDGGQATSAELNYPTGVAFDASGNLFFSDQGNNVVRKINTSGVITTVVGNGSQGFSGDGGVATSAKLYNPTYITFDAAGNLYITDTHNHCIRMVNTSGIISTIAGNGIAGFSGDGGLAINAELKNPSGIVFDIFGNLYIVDTDNFRIRKINTSGIINTIAGNGIQGFSGDGGLATNSELNVAAGIVFSTLGDLYIADQENNRIRKINNSGIITTIAGNGTPGFSGDGGQASSAQLHYPAGICLDSSGNLFVIDTYNNCIRKIDSIGIISTIVGMGTVGFSGDGGQAILAELNKPAHAVFDAVENLYISDWGNDRIRIVTNAGQINLYELGNKNEELKIYPNPTSTIINVAFRQFHGDNQILKIEDVVGNTVKELKIKNAESIIDVSELNNGIYFLSLETENGKTTKKIIKN